MRNCAANLQDKRYLVDFRMIKWSLGFLSGCGFLCAPPQNSTRSRRSARLFLSALTLPQCVGVCRESTTERFHRKNLGRQPVIVSESNEELYEALSHRRIDAIIDDTPIAIHFATTSLA
jgi:hypothetical protein